MVTAWSFKRSMPNCLWLHHQKRLHWYIYIRNEISPKNSMKTLKHLRGFQPRPLLGSATGHWPWLAHRPAAQCYTSFLVTHPRWTSRRRVNRLTSRRGNAFLPGVRVELSRKTRSPKSFKIGGPLPSLCTGRPWTGATYVGWAGQRHILKLSRQDTSCPELTVSDQVSYWKRTGIPLKKPFCKATHRSFWLQAFIVRALLGMQVWGPWSNKKERIKCPKIINPNI